MWLWMDLSAQAPVLIPFVDLPRKPIPVKSPVALFMRAHIVGRTLRSIERMEGLGRVVRLYFSPDESVYLEAHLFPRGQNLLVQSEGKKVYFARPKSSAPPPVADEIRDFHPRDFTEIREEWLNARATRPKSKAEKAPADELRARVQKQHKAIRKVEEELKRKTELPWRFVGEWLNTHRSLRVPPEWEAFVDGRRSLAWNVDHCFAKAKENEQKIKGTEERLRILHVELGRLEKNLETGNWVADRTASLTPQVHSVEARTLKLTADMKAVVGRSAKDNLKLLRQARAWDLWLHLRDFPSSHAILFRNKGRSVTDEELLRTAQWLIQTNFGAKAKLHLGERFAVLVAECRHVRPIKGDRIGRVHYQNERVMTIRFDA